MFHYGQIEFNGHKQNFLEQMCNVASSAVADDDLHQFGARTYVNKMLPELGHLYMQAWYSNG